MLKNICKFLVFVFVLSASGVVCAGQEDLTSPESLIARAIKTQEIWTDGTPPILLRSEIHVFGAKGKETTGQYQVDWMSSSRWREELEIANYKRVRVHNAEGYWQTSTLKFRPEIIFQLDSLLDFKNVLNGAEGQSLSKVKNRDKDGVRQKCIEVKGRTGVDRVLCFDEVAGNLLSVEYLRHEHQNPPSISRIEYSAFDKVGERRIPSEVRAFRDKTVVATVKIIGVTPITEEKAELFVAPANSEFWRQCDEMHKLELVNRVQPEYPSSARSSGEQGRVIFYAVIEADGTVSHLTVIQMASFALDSNAADAVRQWRYKPAACGSTPIRVETSIAVDFALQR